MYQKSSFIKNYYYEDYDYYNYYYNGLYICIL
jgi:hypothetical protein